MGLTICPIITVIVLIIVIVVMNQVQHAFSLNITVCSCERPVYVGIIDIGLPQACKDKSEIGFVKPIEYDEITRHEEPVKANGYMCRTWNRTKSVTSFFFGGWNTEASENERNTSVDECVRMFEEKKCGPNGMIKHDDYWSYIKEPVPPYKWMTTQVETVMNCELEVFRVTQDHPGAPIKSKFGVLAANENSSSLIKGIYTYFWEKPEYDPSICSYKVARSAQGNLTIISNNTARVRDDLNQLEYIIYYDPIKMCLGRAYQVKGIKDLFITLKHPKSRNATKNLPAVTNVRGAVGTTGTTKSPTIKEESRISQLEKHEKILPIEGHIFEQKSALCLIKDNSSNTLENSIVTTTPCSDNKKLAFRFKDGQLILIKSPHLCLAKEGKRVWIRKCFVFTTTDQHWLFEKRSLSHMDGTCFHLTEDAVEPIGGTSRLMKLEMLPCEITEKTNQTWTISNLTHFENNEMPRDEAAIDMAEHEQYIIGIETENDNILGSNVQKLFCETERMKKHLASSLAHHNGVLAARALGLNECQRIQAYGLTQIVEQCRALKVQVKVTHSAMCGWQPFWERDGVNYTVARDGFSEVKFVKCSWINGVVNFNSKIYQYINDEWLLQSPSIDISGVGMQTHFTEHIDKSIRFLENWENVLKPVEMEQSNIMGQILSMLHHQEDRSSITPLLVAKEERLNSLRVSWPNFDLKTVFMKFWRTISTFGLTTILVLGLVVFCWKRRSDRAPPLIPLQLSRPEPVVAAAPIVISRVDSSSRTTDVIRSSPIEINEPRPQRLRKTRSKVVGKGHESHKSFNVYYDGTQAKLRYQDCGCDVTSSSE